MWGRCLLRAFDRLALRGSGLGVDRVPSASVAFKVYKSLKKYALNY